MVATARLRHFAGFRVIRTNIRHPSLAFLSLGSANSAGTSSCVTLDSGVECAKYDGDALLRECFNWQESRYVRDMPITGTSPCNLFGGGDVKSMTEGSAERGVAGAQKHQAW